MGRRRNGLEASCEPCRQAKIRCDHSKPICGRCRRRGLQFRCYYHPAPLTKASDLDVQSAVPPIEINTYIPTPRSPANSSSGFSLGFGKYDIPIAEKFRSPGFNLGFGKYDIALAEKVCDSRNHSGLIARPLDMLHDGRVALVESVLQELHNLPLLQRVVTKYYAISKSANIPGPLVLPAIDSLFGLMKDTEEGRQSSLRSLAEAVIRSTERPIVITESLTPQEFLGMQTGRNLRLEYLGIIYSIASRASVVMLEKEDLPDHDLVHRLYEHSDTCLQLASGLSPEVTDAMVWLSIENAVNCTVACGDACGAVEQHLSKTSTLLFARHYHRESAVTSNTPFFLSEARRWAFAKAYNCDILLSTHRGRPPHILMRHSDIRLLLDLADDDIAAEAAQREQACSRLSADGWNTEGRFSTATFRRVRSISLSLREEALEYEYRPTTMVEAAELSALSIRSKKAWSDLPSHMRYSSDCWESGLSPVICMALLIDNLGFLQTDLEIFKVMERADPQATPSLVRVAHEMLTLVSGLSDARGRSPYIHHEFSSVVLSYGVPPAAVLTTAAKKLAQRTSSDPILPDGFTWSTLIRSLSVFAAQLDSMSTSRESNAEACGRAAGVISRTLDELLNVPHANNVAQEPPTTTERFNLVGTDFQDLNFDTNLDDFDLTSWIKSIEGTSNAIEW